MQPQQLMVSPRDMGFEPLTLGCACGCCCACCCSCCLGSAYATFSVRPPILQACMRFLAFHTPSHSTHLNIAHQTTVLTLQVCICAADRRRRVLYKYVAKGFQYT